MIKISNIFYFFFIGLLLFCFKITVAQVPEKKSVHAVIPLPAEYKSAKGIFTINGSLKIVCADPYLLQAAELLQFYLSALTGKKAAIANAAAAANNIYLLVDSSVVPQKEGYHLTVAPGGISLVAHDPAGIVYGIQTLRQLWKQQEGKSLTVTACSVKDYPRFAYRGMALDVSRHMFPVSFIKKYIDLLSLYKLNTFHWHLTDDQGWRIEIKKYPLLQSIAAWRKETLIGHKRRTPHRFDGKRYGGYYTQEEAKEIVQYASKRNITIIPEIEMPGHALAALAAYPYLGCTGGPYTTATFWGVFDDVYCAGNDAAFHFIQDVLDEVMAVFPSAKIHIGGDECPKTRWKACPKCQRRMKQLGLIDEHALQAYFIQRIEKYINSKGRKIIGWDEILEGGLAPNATVMSWRGEAGGIAAAKEQHEVIMTPESNLYFDYYQSLYPGQPLAAGGFTPLKKVYGYEPAAGIPDAAARSYITGLEGQAWSEYFIDTSQAEFMIFPRMTALAEIAWTDQQLKNYPDFLKRLRLQSGLMKQLKVNYSTGFDQIHWRSSAVKKGMITVGLESTLPGAEIHYTLDGTEPGINSRLYTGQFVIGKTATLKALLFSNNKATGSTLAQVFYLHRAVGQKIEIANAAEARFSQMPSTLLNGITGNDQYNDMQWMGFAEKDFEAVIDLGNVQPIHTVAMNFLNYPWQKMWPPGLVKICISENGQEYKLVYEQRDFLLSGINHLEALIDKRKARFVKVTGTNKGIIPVGWYGAGGKALLMIDEIMID